MNLFRTLCFTLMMLTALSALAAGPGDGIRVQPVMSSNAEETFQTLLVAKVLERLGYDVQPAVQIDYAEAHVTIAEGRATFMANHWDPLHDDFFTAAGGEARLSRDGIYAFGSFQGYLADSVTANRHKIVNLAQFRSPEVAALFDPDGNGKANLVGCPAGWGCEKVIEHHLDAYGLRDTVEHIQGDYASLMSEAIAHNRAGKPILYYTWMPYWVSGVLVPNRDVSWLQVPFSSLPGSRGTIDTSLPDGSNYGFQANSQRIVANREFVDANPAAAKLFEMMELSVNDISEQNLRMRDGENSTADIERHVNDWIRTHQETFDDWIRTAEAALK